MDPIEVTTRAQVELFGQGRFELADELTTPNVVDHGGPEPTHGRDALLGTIRWIHSGLDDVSYEVRDAFASGDRVTIRATMRGTFAREWMGKSPTGRSFEVEHIHVYRLEDGRVAEHWGARDDLGMMRQIGMLD
jgi:predicted ester cyclase